MLSILSLVVPETSETITLFSPNKAFTIEDLPALGLPTIAILIIFSSSLMSSSAVKSSVIKSNKSPTPPEPCKAEIAIGSPIASE